MAGNPFIIKIRRLTNGGVKVRLVPIMLSSLFFLVVGCTISAEEKSESQDFNRVPVTIRVLNEQGDPLPGAEVTIALLQDTKQKEKFASVTRLTDPKGQVFEDLGVGKKYQIHVFSEEKEITVSEQTTMIRITVRSRGDS